ncbi:MAG: hypothetical protein JXM79_16155 [Sedimentisphaerales bacterium]|nr:hypothetical protein [Sedimentisphaerales bacterium]
MKSTKDIKQSIKKLAVESNDRIHDRILDKLLSTFDKSKNRASVEQLSLWKIISWGRAGYLAAACLVISLCMVCFVLYGKVNDLSNELEQSRQDVSFAQPDDSATINLYLKEHRDAVARHVSYRPDTPQPAQMRVSPQDILYYELLDDGPEFTHPGIIVRGPSSEREIDSSKAPVISNGHTLTLSKARETANFDLVASPWLHPYYKLDQIRRIEDRDALQLLYTDGIHSVSLFEQPLDGQHGLSHHDFREYAVYRNAKQSGGIILAWRDDVLSYVLIGTIEMSQLMDMAQSISAAK